MSLVVVPATQSQRGGPVLGAESVRPGIDDLTRQHAGESLGECIIIAVGKVMDEDESGLPNTLVNIWQANAAVRATRDRLAAMKET